VGASHGGVPGAGRARFAACKAWCGCQGQRKPRRKMTPARDSRPVRGYTDAALLCVIGRSAAKGHLMHASDNSGRTTIPPSRMPMPARPSTQRIFRMRRPCRGRFASQNLLCVRAKRCCEKRYKTPRALLCCDCVKADAAPKKSAACPTAPGVFRSRSGRIRGVRFAPPALARDSGCQKGSARIARRRGGAPQKIRYRWMLISVGAVAGLLVIYAIYSLL